MTFLTATQDVKTDVNYTYPMTYARGETNRKAKPGISLHLIPLSV